MQWLLTLLVALLNADFTVERSLSAAAICLFVVCLDGHDPMIENSSTSGSAERKQRHVTSLTTEKYVFKDGDPGT